MVKDEDIIPTTLLLYFGLLINRDTIGFHGIQFFNEIFHGLRGPDIVELETAFRARGMIWGNQGSAGRTFFNVSNLIGFRGCQICIFFFAFFEFSDCLLILIFY